MIEKEAETTPAEMAVEDSDQTLARLKQVGRHLTLLGKRKTPQERRSECVDLDEEDLRSSLLPMSHRYQFDCPLGMGGMSLVLLARDRLLGRQVAVKILRHDIFDRTAAEKRFFREARIHGQLQHAGIAPLYDIGKFDDGRPCIVMRYLRGKTFDEILQETHSNGAISPEEFAKIFEVFATVCRTMAYAHRKGVIHRDLKPLNIMVTANGQVQVLDWGLSKVLGEEEDEDPGQSLPSRGSRLGLLEAHGENPLETRVGASIGTPAYISPEQAMGRLSEVDQRSDVFGLGAILCEILTGQPPYVGQFPQVTIAAARGDLSGAFQRLDACKAPDPLIQLAKNCLATNPADRPADAAAVSMMVENYQAQLTAKVLQKDRADIFGLPFRCPAWLRWILTFQFLLGLAIGWLLLAMVVLQ